MRIISHCLPIGLVSLILSTLFISGCQKKPPSPQEVAVPELYHKTTTLLKEYGDSIEKAKDSVGVFRYMDDLLVNLTRINFNLPPNTDLVLSEDENDTIYQLTRKVLSLRDKRLSDLAGDTILKIDSITHVENLNKN